MQILKGGRRALFAVPLLLALAAGSTVQAAPRQAAATAPVKIAAGKILVNAKGLTLYVFAKDPASKSTCYSTCAKYWPPVLVAKGVMPPAKMDGVTGTFGVIMRTDGTDQLTFDKAPLYTFLEDKEAGDAYGQGLFASGGFWWAVVAPGS